MHSLDILQQELSQASVHHMWSSEVSKAMKVKGSLWTAHIKGDARSLVLVIMSHILLLRILWVFIAMTVTWRQSGHACEEV